MLKQLSGGEWEIELEYMNKQTVRAKQHLIRKSRGKCAQEILGLIPADILKKLQAEKEAKANPKAKPVVCVKAEPEKKEKTQAPESKKEKKKAKKKRKREPEATSDSTEPKAKKQKKTAEPSSQITESQKVT